MGNSFKTQILNIITESYIKKDKEKLKNLLKLLKENKGVRDLYLLYDDIENKHFDDIEVAKTYIEKLSEGLCGKILVNDNSINIKKILSENIESYDVENSQLYSNLDILLKEDTLRNIDEKIIAKKELVKYLTEPRKEKEESIDSNINENLLNSVLTTNFNAYYDNVLSEEEKTDFKSIISMSNDELNQKFIELKEDVTTKLNSMLTESQGDLKEKLEMSKNELISMNVNKINYFKLKELKNGL